MLCLTIRYSNSLYLPEPTAAPCTALFGYPHSGGGGILALLKINLPFFHVQLIVAKLNVKARLSHLASGV